jgi:hypothetical protein
VSELEEIDKTFKQLLTQISRIADRLDSWDRTWQGRSQTFHQLSTVGTTFEAKRKDSDRRDDRRDDRGDYRR